MVFWQIARDRLELKPARRSRRDLAGRSGASAWERGSAADIDVQQNRCARRARCRHGAPRRLAWGAPPNAPADCFGCDVSWPCSFAEPHELAPQVTAGQRWSTAGGLGHAKQRRRRHGGGGIKVNVDRLPAISFFSSAELYSVLCGRSCTDHLARGGSRVRHVRMQRRRQLAGLQNGSRG